MQAAVEGRPLPAEITKQAVQCRTLSCLWQLQLLFKTESQPDSEWTASVTLFMEQLQLLLQVEDLDVKGIAVRAVADLLLIFRPATIQVSSRGISILSSPFTASVSDKDVQASLIQQIEG